MIGDPLARQSLIEGAGGQQWHGSQGHLSGPNQPKGEQPRPGKEVAGCESQNESKGSLVTGCEFRMSGTRPGEGGNPANGESRFARSRG